MRHSLHHECLSVLHYTAHVNPDTWLYDYQESLVHATDSARIYNHAGAVDKSMAILDWCTALLSYGKTIVTAAAEGMIDGIIDIFSHPVQLGIAVVAPEYMLAYQLAHVLYRVADIGITYAIDPAHVSDKLYEWFDPLIALIDAAYQQQITLEQAVRTGTR